MVIFRIASYGRSDDLPSLVGGSSPQTPPLFEGDMRKRIVRKSVRFTPEEANKLELIANAKGITVSELIRRSALGLELPQKASPERLAKRSEIFRRYLYEVNKIGVNLNQIARHCNKYREVDVLVLERLIEIERALKDLLNRLYEELTDVDKSSSREK